MTFVDVPEAGTPQGNPADGFPAPAADSGEGLGSEPQGERLDVDSYGDHLVPVKVDGKEEYVPLSELREGHMRHKDYTQKTQELADQRRQLQQYEALATALNEDPVGTIQALAGAYQVPLGHPDDTQEPNVQDADLDPQEQELRAVKAELQELKAQQARTTIENQLSSLEQQYGDVDREAVMRYAARNGVPLADAYKSIHFDELRQKQAEIERQIEEQKRVAGQAVHRGGSTQRGTLGVPKGKKMGLRESFFAALDQANKGSI